MTKRGLEPHPPRSTTGEAEPRELPHAASYPERRSPVPALLGSAPGQLLGPSKAAARRLGLHSTNSPAGIAALAPTMPETGGLSLEEIDALFDVASPRDSRDRDAERDTAPILAAHRHDERRSRDA